MFNKISLKLNETLLHLLCTYVILGTVLVFRNILYNHWNTYARWQMLSPNGYMLSYWFPWKMDWFRLIIYGLDQWWWCFYRFQWYKQPVMAHMPQICHHWPRHKGFNHQEDHWIHWTSTNNCAFPHPGFCNQVTSKTSLLCTKGHWEKLFTEKVSGLDFSSGYHRYSKYPKKSNEKIFKQKSKVHLANWKPQ